MNRPAPLFLAPALAYIFFAAACGGGPSGSSTPPPNQNPAPMVTSVSPSSAAVGAAETPVTLSGSGFIASSTVEWNGAALTTTFASATSLNTTIPASDLASATVGQLTVVNPAPGGGTSSPVSFSVNDPAPTITSVSPSSVTAGANDTMVTITGTGFVAGSFVGWNGVEIATRAVSATQLVGVVPGADLSGSSTNQITVQNPAPGGGASGAATFTVNSPTPAISSISPAYVPPGAAATITITGTGFESNSTALWNTSPRPTTFVGATALMVALTAADLANQGTGSLTVSNPAPGAATSGGSTLTVTSTPVPVIQSVSITPSSQTSLNGCPELLATITGENIAGDFLVEANGIPLTPNGGTFSSASDTVYALFPAGFVSMPGSLSITIINPDGGAVLSNPFPYPPTSPPALTFCVNPSGATVYAPSSFSISVMPSEVNLGVPGTLTLGTLPAGISWSTTSVPLPPNTTTTIHLQAASTTAAGASVVVLNAAVGIATAQENFNFTVSAGTPPAFGFSGPLQGHEEVGVPIGGSGSIEYYTIVSSNSAIDYDVTPSMSGLPPGTTASFSPSEFPVGQSVTVTLSAASNAPVTQNASVTLIGTASVQVGNATASFFVDVTQPPGSLPGNRSDFVSTAGTPYAAVYDPTHNLIFSSNPSWNRVDVISNQTHQIVKSIAVLSPRGIDITQDNSTVWVQTASLNVQAINTASLQVSHYSLPSTAVASSGLPVSASTDRLFALSDGTLFLFFNDTGAGGGGQVGVWNPQTGQLTILKSGTITAFGVPVRSGDGEYVYASNDEYANGMEVYTASSKSLSTLNSATVYPPVVAVSDDGSELVLGSASMALYNSNLTQLGPVPGTLTGFGPDFLLDGGILFSADGSKLYEVGQSVVPAILTISASNLTTAGIAPTANSEGGGDASSTPTPFAIDATGMVLCIQNYGISFEDSTFYQNYAAAGQPSVGGGLIVNLPAAGPLAGGTVSTLYVFPDLTPDVWFGQIRGSASIASAGGIVPPGELTFTSPPSTTPGPVNVKFIYPDGETMFAPQLFSYSTFPEYAVLSGSAPQGGAPAQVIGYGLPEDASGGTVSVGSNTATITSTLGQYPPFSAEPIPSTVLDYTFPQGRPGLADLTVTTPIGSGTLPKSIYYAKSVTDYSSSDTFSAVLFDSTRNQVYLSAGNHIDVFSTTANEFVTPLAPAATGTTKQFNGLALTPEGSQLLAADLPDGSLGVIDPDAPSATSAIPIAAAAVSPDTNCLVGPIYVAATSAGQAFVDTGSLPPSCPPSGGTYLANLTTATVAQSQCGGGIGVDASSDGNFVVIGGVPPAGAGETPCVYATQTATFTVGDFPYTDGGWDVAISGDANVIVGNLLLGDINANFLGWIAQPIALYGSNAVNALLHPRFNAAGSLLYLAYPNYFEIIDVPTATLRMRFSLTETVQSVAAPIAIDSGGRYVFLITNQGLTVVDLGEAPLSIGHLTPQSASAGTPITVRGSGFDATVKATVGGVAASVTVTDQNTLTLTLPSAASGPEDIVLTRGDGEVYTLQNGVIIQ
jgi:IPT/TIG domain